MLKRRICPFFTDKLQVLERCWEADAEYSRAKDARAKKRLKKKRRATHSEVDLAKKMCGRIFPD